MTTGEIETRAVDNSHAKVHIQGIAEVIVEILDKTTGIEIIQEAAGREATLQDGKTMLE